ncbi:MAG: helix-turn-helix domain-containing protein [Bacillota bacterium]
MQATGELLTTAQVCRELGVTPAKIRRLTREGYLEVSGKVAQKYGEEYLYRSDQVRHLKHQMPKILSKWATEENFRNGRQAGMTRAAESMNAAGVKKRRDEFLSSLYDLPEKTANLLKASYYLFHLNHYAKSGHQYLYEIKERILKYFVRNYLDTPFFQVILVQGQQRIDLCTECRTRASKLNMTYGEYAKSYGGCPRCARHKSYYDLYEFNIQYDSHSFSFHTPYSVGRKWFSRDASFPRRYRGHRQEQGMAFGRPITEKEARALPMDEVIANLEKILENDAIPVGKPAGPVETLNK